ncbi:hypothetical protein SLE2022_279880 [Rubroshorea leprosula]
MARRYCCSELLPFAAMVGAECSTVGLNILFKAATLRGMSYNIFNAYSFAISTLVLIPFLFIFPSLAVPPSFKFPLISRICLLAFIGSFGQILGYKGIEYSSPTLASSISNLTPAFTFILAIIFRMEKIAFRSSSTQAKIIGTIVSISGAFVAVLYKGPTVFSSAPPVLLQWHLGSSSLSNWLIGGLLLVAQYLLFSIWYIVQAQVMKMYPAELTVVFLYNLFATIIPSIAIAAVIYSGFVGAVINVVHTWGLHLKGPVYIAIFKPLSIVIAAAMSALFLGDALYLGSVIGAVIISIGFYAVLWGKAKEEAMEEDSLVRSLLIPSSNDQFPLSQNTKL